MVTMPFKTAVVELTRQINNLLFQLGGTGTDISERLYNIPYLLDEYEVRQLRYIASIEHAVVKGKNVSIKGEQQRCIHTCEWMVKRLELHLSAQAECRKNGLKVPVQSPARYFLESLRPELGLASIIYLVLGVGSFCLMILPFLCARTVEVGEWPYNRMESITVWPEVIFWTLAVSMATCYALRRFAAQPLGSGPS